MRKDRETIQQKEEESKPGRVKPILRESNNSGKRNKLGPSAPNNISASKIRAALKRYEWKTGQPAQPNHPKGKQAPLGERHQHQTKTLLPISPYLPRKQTLQFGHQPNPINKAALNFLSISLWWHNRLATSPKVASFNDILPKMKSPLIVALILWVIYISISSVKANTREYQASFRNLGAAATGSSVSHLQVPLAIPDILQTFSRTYVALTFVTDLANKYEAEKSTIRELDNAKGNLPLRRRDNSSQSDY